MLTNLLIGSYMWFTWYSMRSWLSVTTSNLLPVVHVNGKKLLLHQMLLLLFKTIQSFQKSTFIDKNYTPKEEKVKICIWQEMGRYKVTKTRNTLASTIQEQGQKKRIFYMVRIINNKRTLMEISISQLQSCHKPTEGCFFSVHRSPSY